MCQVSRDVQHFHFDGRVVDDGDHLLRGGRCLQRVHLDSDGRHQHTDRPLHFRHLRLQEERVEAAGPEMGLLRPP